MTDNGMNNLWLVWPRYSIISQKSNLDYGVSPNITKTIKYIDNQNFHYMTSIPE